MFILLQVKSLLYVHSINLPFDDLKLNPVAPITYPLEQYLQFPQGIRPTFLGSRGVGFKSNFAAVNSFFKLGGWRVAKRIRFCPKAFTNFCRLSTEMQSLTTCLLNTWAGLLVLVKTIHSPCGGVCLGCISLRKAKFIFSSVCPRCWR